MSKNNNNYKEYINRNGDPVMRVSTVIKTLAKDQLIMWANMLGFKRISYTQELERTANIGTLCHAVIEDYFNPRRLAVIDYDEYNITSYGDKVHVRRALDSMFNWLKKLNRTYNIKFTELTVIGEELGGTIDCGIEGWDDPEKVIFIDYKTSSGIYLTMFLQLAAYVMLYEEIYGTNTVEGVMVVQLDKKYGGDANAKFISRENLGVFISIFQSLMQVAIGTKTLEKLLPKLAERVR